MGSNSFVSSRLQHNAAHVTGNVVNAFFPNTSTELSTIDLNSQASLAEALARVPGDLNIPLEFGFRVVVNGKEKNLKTEIYEQIYRIGQEAIVNACRHSGATKIEIEIEYLASELRIVVRDNGCGIDPSDLHWGRDGHYGLQEMRERADLVGARFRL